MTSSYYSTSFFVLDLVTMTFFPNVWQTLFKFLTFTRKPLKPLLNYNGPVGSCSSKKLIEDKNNMKYSQVLPCVCMCVILTGEAVSKKLFVPISVGSLSLLVVILLVVIRLETYTDCSMYNLITKKKHPDQFSSLST